MTHKKGQHCQWALRAATPAPATNETIEQRTRGLGASVRSRSEDGHEASMIDQDGVAVAVGVRALVGA